MYLNLHSRGIGNFTTAGYWFSSEQTGILACQVLFYNGQSQAINKDVVASVRVARKF